MNFTVYSRDNANGVTVKHLLKTVKIDFVEYKYERLYRNMSFKRSLVLMPHSHKFKLKIITSEDVRRHYNGYKEKKSYEEL